MSKAIEWNADVYHNVSNPHVDWGSRIVASLHLRGDETAADLGCGTGRLTAELLHRLPKGSVIAVDRSRNMLEVASAHLDLECAGRVRYVQADVQNISVSDIGQPVDLVFSTATFHWISDHGRLFNNLFRLLSPGGRLVAQCGGGPNLERLLTITRHVMTSDDFAPYFGGWDGPWQFADAETTAARLNAAGFCDIETEIVSAPVVMDDPEELRAFLTTVIFGEHLARLPDDALKHRFIEAHLSMNKDHSPLPELDYWRLNMKGTRPDVSP